MNHPSRALVESYLDELKRSRCGNDVDLLCEVFELAKCKMEVLPDHIQSLRRLAALEDGYLNICSQTILGLVGEDNQVARGVISQMAASIDLRERLAAVFCLNKNMPLDFLVEMVELLVSDKSMKVRGGLLEKVADFGFYEFLPILVRALEVEKSNKIKSAIAREIEMIKFGEHVFSLPNGDRYLLKRGALGRDLVKLIAS